MTAATSDLSFAHVFEAGAGPWTLLLLHGTVSLLFRHPGVLRGAVLLRPMLPYEPVTPLALNGTDVQIAAGEGDPFSSPEQSRRLAEILSVAGATVAAGTEPGAGHSLTQGDLLRAGQWLAALAGTG